MSGVCGVWRRDDSRPLHNESSAMTEASDARHPGSVQRTSVGAAELAVSSSFKTQQLYRDEWIVVVCDADLANSKELADLACIANSADLNTAALLAALYERFGDSFVRKLNGAFSVILWDGRAHRLVAAVDHFGIKRLTYYEAGPTLWISSRIDTLLERADILGRVDPKAIAAFINFGVSLAPSTIFSDVFRLLPGTMLIATDSVTRISPYWDMTYGAGQERNEKRLSERLEFLVRSAVQARCAEAEFSSLGAFLSGGTDSSTVVGMMGQLGRGQVNTFSIGFAEEMFNELQYAEITARKFHTAHTTYRVSAADCLEALPKMIGAFDEPFANSSAIPTFFCSKLAAEHGVRVLLAGDGGDELFAGNERYLTDKRFESYRHIPALLRNGLIDPILSRVPEAGILGKAKRYVRRSNLPAFERYFSYNFLCAHQVSEIFEGDFIAGFRNDSLLERPARYYRDAPAQDHLDRLLYVDVKMTLGDSDLPKVSQMAELAGIQTRFPFLDPSVAEFSGLIPVNLKVKGWEKRYLFKRAFRNLLPQDVLRKKKHGFGIPVAFWLKSDKRMRELARDTLFSSRALRRGYFRREFLDKLIRLHEADETPYYGDTVWSFLVLELWHRHFVDRARVPICM